MPALTPNSPVSRFEWVLKQYWGKPLGKPEVGDVQQTLDGVVLDVFAVTISLVGAEARVGMPGIVISHEVGSIGVRFSTHELSIEKLQKTLDAEDHLSSGLLPKAARAKAAQAMLRRLGHPYEYDSKGLIRWDAEEWGLASLVLQAVGLPEHSPADFLIPWVARELVALAKEVANANEPRVWSAQNRDYEDAVRALIDKAPAIAQWAKETRTDIGKVDLATALEAIKTYKFKRSLVEQGTVVYTFKDGWTVQELRSENALTQEGKNMQNCVGGYCEDVERGATRIYSVRDPSGQPHVTMELVPPDTTDLSAYGEDLSPEEFARSPKRLAWHFNQILGKQNDMPIDEYRARAREFIDKVFEKEGIGWCVAGGTPKWGRFAGRQLNDVDFGDVLAVNHAELDTFAGANFFDTNLVGSKLPGLTLSGCNFEKARLSEADFSHANLDEAKLDGAQCHFTLFGSASLKNASLDSAHCGGATFDEAVLAGTSFRDASVDGASFQGASTIVGAESTEWKGVELSEHQRKQLGFDRAEKILGLDWRTKGSR